MMNWTFILGFAIVGDRALTTWTQEHDSENVHSRGPSSRGMGMKDQIQYWYIVAQELDLLYWIVLVSVAMFLLLLLTWEPFTRRYKKWKWKKKIMKRRN